MLDISDPFEFGFVTIATGRQMYVEMAVDLALSLKEFHDDPVVLLTDVSGKNTIATKYQNVFDRVIVLPEGLDHGFISKCALAEFAPLKHAVFIDSDCLAVAPLTQARDCALAGGMWMMGEVIDAAKLGFSMHNFVSSAYLCSVFESDHYFRNHGAVYAYEREAAQPIMRDARDVFRRLGRMNSIRVPKATDEVAFGIMGAKHGIKSLPSPRPIHWSTDLIQIPDGQWFKPIVHFHSLLNSVQFKRLMKQTEARRKALGFPQGPSTTAWRAKLQSNRWNKDMRALNYALKWIKMKVRVKS